MGSKDVGRERVEGVELSAQMNDLTAAGVLKAYHEWEDDEEQGYTELMELVSERMVPALEAAQRSLESARTALERAFGYGSDKDAVDAVKKALTEIAGVLGGVKCEHERWFRASDSKSNVLGFVLDWHNTLLRANDTCLSCGITADKVLDGEKA